MQQRPSKVIISVNPRFVKQTERGFFLCAQPHSHKPGGGRGLESVPAYILKELSRLEDTANATNKILTAISGYVNSGAITEDQARELGRKYGLEL